MGDIHIYIQNEKFKSSLHKKILKKTQTILSLNLVWTIVGHSSNSICI